MSCELEPPVAENDNMNKGLSKKLKYIMTHITVEPIIFLAVLPSVMNHLTTQNLNLEKACRVNLKFNTSACDAMASRDRTGYELIQEEAVQKMVANMVAIKMAIVGSYPAFLMLFLGSWSDRHGRRKPVILMPVIGELISSVLLLICSYYFLELSVEYAMLSESIPIAFGGTWACGFMGIYTYVSGLCNDNDRTLRIGAVSMCQNISITLGIFCSGILINAVGFKGVYSVSVTTMLLAVIYGVIRIEEKWTLVNEAKQGVAEFFALKHIKNTFSTCFKQGSDNRRSKMFVLMFLSTMIMGPIHGEMAVVYLYTRIKCGWNEVDFSLYNSLHSVIQIFGSVFALSFFSKFLKLNDAMLGVIAMISKISACLIFAFAPSGLFFYIGAFVEVFHGTCHIALRSLMAKIVPTHELGQSNSVIGVFESVTPLIFGPLYTKLYYYTITFFPGMFYIFTAGLYVITFGLFYWMHKTYKEEEKRRLETIKEKEETEELLKLKQTELKKSTEKIPA